MTALGWAQWGEFTASLSDKSNYSLFMLFVLQTWERFTFLQTETNHPWRLLVSSWKEADSFCWFQSILISGMLSLCNHFKGNVRQMHFNSSNKSISVSLQKSYFLSFKPRFSRRCVHCPLQKNKAVSLWQTLGVTHNHTSDTQHQHMWNSQWQLWSQRPLQLQVNLILYRMTEMDLSNLCCWRGTKSNLNNSRATPIFKLLLFWTEGRDGLKKRREREICLSESSMGKQRMVKCFYTSRLTSVIYGIGSDFGGRRRFCFLASLYCSRGNSFNIKEQNSHFDISQQLLTPEPLRKTFTLQASLSLSLSSSLSLLHLATLLLSFLQSKQTSFQVIPHNPSFCLCRAAEPATLHSSEGPL